MTKSRETVIFISLRLDGNLDYENRTGEITHIYIEKNRTVYKTKKWEYVTLLGNPRRIYRGHNNAAYCIVQYKSGIAIL